MLRFGNRLTLRCINTKWSTGISGLDVVPDAREVLIGLYKKTLEEIKVVPEHAGYRIGVDQITKFRLKACEELTDCKAIEDRIDDGQVEELIEQARAELSLIPKMVEWTPWDVPKGTPEPQVVDEDASERSAPSPTPSQSK